MTVFLLLYGIWVLSSLTILYVRFNNDIKAYPIDHNYNRFYRMGMRIVIKSIDPSVIAVILTLIPYFNIKYTIGLITNTVDLDLVIE